MRSLLLIFFVHVSFLLSAQQNEYNLKYPDPKDHGKICGEFMNRVHSMPADVTMGFYEQDGIIYWGITDDTWLARIIKENKDGIAVDIISRSQFPCGTKNVMADSRIYKGELLKPVLLRDVKNKILTDKEGMAGFKMGALPEKYKGSEYEMNMILIHDGYVCNYNSFYDVPRARFELLAMPLFLDTAKAKVTKGDAEPVRLKKSMRFVIPFEKNKTNYDAEYIRRIYDSLKLKDYEIRTISITAYASVEGPTDNNIRLQNNRAEVIAKALEHVQDQTAVKHIKAEENWVEFLRDVDTTIFPDVHLLSRSAIKSRLEDQKLSEKLEPLLRHHRKAEVVLDLEGRTTYMQASGTALAEAFRTSVTKGDTAEALAIQEAAFTRAMNGELPRNLLDTIEIPETRPFIYLHNNRIAFKSAETLEDINRQLQEFTVLSEKFPGYQSVDYNIAVLKIRAWSKGEKVDPAALRNDIKSLSKGSIAPALVKRMFINYHIVLSELLLSERKYDAKNKALKFIYDNYRSLSLNDKDLLELAKYFSSYSRFDWAEKILLPRLKSMDVSEDLIFYYLNLTIIDPKNIKKSSYKTIVNHAASKNAKRFCGMFDPYGRGGINFQLLGDDYLKKMYCEVCK